MKNLKDLREKYKTEMGFLGAVAKVERLIKDRIKELSMSNKKISLGEIKERAIRVDEFFAKSVKI